MHNTYIYIPSHVLDFKQRLTGDGTILDMMHKKDDMNV